MIRKRYEQFVLTLMQYIIIVIDATSRNSRKRKQISIKLEKIKASIKNL